MLGEPRTTAKPAPISSRNPKKPVICARRVKQGCGTIWI